MTNQESAKRALESARGLIDLLDPRDFREGFPRNMYDRYKEHISAYDFLSDTATDATAERAAIVKWLRWLDNQYSIYGWNTIFFIADAIERGEHHKSEVGASRRDDDT